MHSDKAASSVQPRAGGPAEVQALVSYSGLLRRSCVHCVLFFFVFVLGFRI